MAQLHLSALQVRVFAQHLVRDGLSKLAQLVVAANHLQLVAREYDVVAIGNVQSMVGTQNAAHVHTIFASKVQLA